MKYSAATDRLLFMTCLIVIVNTGNSCELSSTEFGGFCYSIESRTSTWHTSVTNCQVKGSTLVSIHSMEEAKFLERFIKDRYVSNFWIGLSALNSDGIFQWADNTSVDFTFFSVDEPNNVKNEEDCVTMSKHTGLWNDDNCNKEFRYICKVAKSATVPTTISTTQDPIEGNCLKGWIPYLDRCYYVGGKEENEHLNWYEARDFCDKKGGYLTSIRNSKDQAFLAYLLQVIGEDAWIGFNASDPSFRYAWLDNSDHVYTNWGGYTHGHKKNCAKMQYKHVRSGIWMEETCDRKLGFICYTKKDPNLPPLPFDGGMKCVHPEGWQKLNNMCFQLFEGDPHTRDEAELSCNEKGGHLVSISDISVKAVVYHLTKDMSQDFFIGLKYDKKRQSFKWPNNFPVTISMWEKNEPSYMTEYTCYASTPDGYWKAVSCDSKLPYLCQITKGKPKLNKYVGNCTSSSRIWVAGNNDYCYMMSFQELDYFRARSKCYDLGSRLFSVHSMEETEDLINLFKPEQHSLPIYLGLERNKKGGFRYTDDSPVNFVDWNNGQPSSYKNRVDCVTISTDSMKWSVDDCLKPRRFICKALKSTLIIEDTEEVSKYSIGKSKKVSAAIFGSLLAIGLMGFIYYMLKIRNRSGTEGDKSSPKNDRVEMMVNLNMEQ